MIGLMYLRKKKPPMRALRVSGCVSGNFSCTSDHVALHSHRMPKGTFSIVSFRRFKMRKTKSCSTGTCSEISRKTFGFVSAWRNTLHKELFMRTVLLI